MKKKIVRFIYYPTRWLFRFDCKFDYLFFVDLTVRISRNLSRVSVNPYEVYAVLELALILEDVIEKLFTLDELAVDS